MLLILSKSEVLPLNVHGSHITLVCKFIKKLNSCTLYLIAVVLSPSQDSFYNALPGLITVEEGATPSSQTEHLMNTYFQPSVLPNEQRNSSSKYRVHLTPGIATTSIGTGVSMELEGRRLDNHKIGTMTKEPSAAGVLAHTSHSTVPVSPGELSTKEASTIETLKNNGCQSRLTGEGRVELRDVGDHHNNQFLFPQPAAEQLQMSSGSSKDSKEEMNYKQLMQRSISQGMPGIMNKVINESKVSNTVPTSAQNPASAETSSSTQTRRITTDSPDKHPRSVQPSLSRVKPLYYSPGMGHKTEGSENLKVASERVKLRTLVCSPMEAASRKFPEFVFAPGAAPASTGAGDSGTNSVAEITTGGDGGENRMRSSQMAQSNVRMSSVTVNEGKRDLHYGVGREKPSDGLKRDTKPNPLARRLEFDYENDQVKSKSHLTTTASNQNSKELDGTPTATHDEGPYAHYSTATRCVLQVMAEATLTISFKYHSRASLYPSFLRSAYYSTEMDIMESLHTLLDMKFKEQHRRVQEKQRPAQVIGGNCPVPTTESLMDEARKSLIFSKETPKKANVSLKRPHSFHYRRTRSEISVESADLKSPVKRELLMRRAAEAVKQRKKKSFSEKESDLDALLEQQRNKPEHMNTVPATAMVHAVEHSSRQVQGSNNDHAKSMENLTMTDAQYTLPESSPYTQKHLSSSSYSLHALPTRHISFRESSSSRTNSSYASHRRALPRRSKSFHETSKSSQSLEALHIKSGLLREEGDEELLYTFERKRRPVTVLVRSNSSLSVHNGQTEGARLLSPRTKYHPSSNLMTMKSISSQGLALSEIMEDQNGNRLMFEDAEGSRKRYSRNRPTSAPSERPSHSHSRGSGSSSRESSGLDGLMSSIHLKADKLWWNEL